MKPSRSAIPLVLAIAFQTACGGAAAKAAPPAVPVAASMDASPAPASAPAPALAPAPAPAPAPAKAPKSAPPSVRAAVVLYKGDLKMVADEEAIPKTIDRIIDVAESLGGHVSGRKDDSVQVRVPSASFREALTKIDALGGVTSRSVSADDVSEEFHDLEVRLTN